MRPSAGEHDQVRVVRGVLRQAAGTRGTQPVQQEIAGPRAGLRARGGCFGIHGRHYRCNRHCLDPAVEHGPAASSPDRHAEHGIRELLDGQLPPPPESVTSGLLGSHNQLWWWVINIGVLLIGVLALSRRKSY